MTAWKLFTLGSGRRQAECTRQAATFRHGRPSSVIWRHWSVVSTFVTTRNLWRATICWTQCWKETKRKESRSRYSTKSRLQKRTRHALTSISRTSWTRTTLTSCNPIAGSILLGTMDWEEVRSSLNLLVKIYSSNKMTKTRNTSCCEATSWQKTRLVVWKRASFTLAVGFKKKDKLKPCTDYSSACTRTLTVFSSGYFLAVDLKKDRGLLKFQWDTTLFLTWCLYCQLNLPKRYTNHCVRASVVTDLKDAGFSNYEVCAVTGHKNESSIQSYDRLDRAGSRRPSGMADVLDGKPPPNRPSLTTPVHQANQDVIQSPLQEHSCNNGIAAAGIPNIVLRDSAVVHNITINLTTMQGENQQQIQEQRFEKSVKK